MIFVTEAQADEYTDICSDINLSTVTLERDVKEILEDWKKYSLDYKYF